MVCVDVMVCIVCFGQQLMAEQASFPSSQESGKVSDQTKAVRFSMGRK